jgi:hypothetical protein
MKNENNREVKIQFRIVNPITNQKLGINIGENKYLRPDIYYFNGIIDLELAIEKLIDLRNRFLKEL